MIDHYTTSLQHILAELERIDILINVQVWRARQLHGDADKLQGFYISEEEIDRILDCPVGLPRWATEPLPLSLTEVQTTLEQFESSIAQRKAATEKQGISLRLDILAYLFQLTPFEVDVLLVCLAPEIDLRYERLYAYLQDDITRKRPSVDLVLNLLSPSFGAKLAARHQFLPSAPLLQYQLLHLLADPAQLEPPLLSRFLKIDERIVNFLLDSDELDTQLLPFLSYLVPEAHLEDLLLPERFKQRLCLLLAQHENNTGLVFYFQGPYGLGKQSTAMALCDKAGQGLLIVNGPNLLTIQESAFATAVTRIMREALLQNASLYWQGFDAYLSEENRTRLDVLLGAIASRPRLTFLAGNTAWEPVNALRNKPFVSIPFPRLDYAARQQMWAQSLNGRFPHEATLNIGELANKFRFSGGQIRDAVVTAANLARWRDPEDSTVNMADLYAASRLQSNRNLDALAQKITPHYAWSDIVLPLDQIEQLREICNQVKYKAKVYEEWGFNDKLSLGKGVIALFAGPSGTGKTMAAEIIAGELGLELYKIDLSTVVSKYIGETEKNLSRIFDEAETSNAILFFDEADALFGKRTEVRDAHDRHANIEISYLLQRMEEYEGVVIMTTNLRKNMDDAFMRRMHFAVEFPFPNELYRQRIWRQIWPEATPRQVDLDLRFMAHHFEIAGGNIRNIAVAAAFLAADDGQEIGMFHLIRATQREYQKLGKVVNESEFGNYAGHMRRR